MDDILYALCRHCVGIMDGWHPYPSTAIASQLGMPVGKVRYHLKKLKTQGMVKSFHESGSAEDGDVFGTWGFGITDKAKESDEYKKAYEEESQLYKDTLGLTLTVIGRIKKI